MSLSLRREDTKTKFNTAQKIKQTFVPSCLGDQYQLMLFPKKSSIISSSTV
jgi:hypothetical protein